MSRRSLGLVVILAVAVLAVGCSQKAPAEAAVNAAETAFAAVQEEAGKYVPDQAKAVSDAIAAAKDSVAKGEYKAALTAAQAIPAQVTALGEAVAAKKTELTTAWNSLNESMPQLVKGLEEQIAGLDKAKKLPRGFDKAKLEEAKTGLAGLTSAWTEATTAFGAGNLNDALAKAETVKTGAAKLTELLQPAMPAAVPAAIK